jgi:phage tail-like protein
MRGAVGDLTPAVQVIDLLPAVYQEDHFTRQFLGGFDDVLAPVFSTIDNLAAYVDPALTPADFLPWLAGWVGITLAEDWDIARQRSLVANAVHLYSMRGTVAGLHAELHLYTGGDVSITESGGCAWSQRPGGGDMPGEPSARVAIRIAVDRPEALRLVTVEGIVDAAKPAHVAHSIDITGRKEQS